jgi:hypothetical protein
MTPVMQDISSVLCRKVWRCVCLRCVECQWLCWSILCIGMAEF